jgi:hypothetical protein
MKYVLPALPVTLAVCSFALVAPAAVSAQDIAAAAPTPLALTAPTLEAVVAATERLKDVNVALAEGYIRDPMNICETAEMLGRPAELGVMGVHYFRPDLLGITGVEPRVNGTGTHTDFLSPAVLIYEPQTDGSLELVAVENLTFIDAWEAAGNTARPTFLGVEFDQMADDPATPDIDEGHMFEPHYDLHVWLYRDNPNGMFTQFNPAASCEHHAAKAEHGH